MTYMTETQKKAIYDVILKNFTVSATSFSASCVYENQMIPDGRSSEPLNTNATYPIISLKYHDTDEIVKDMEDVVMKTARLDINVYAISIDERGTGGEYINGKIALDAMTRDILDNIDSNTQSLISYGVIINEKVKAVKVRDLSTIATKKHVYRNKFTLNITYEV
jgi:hypothetical protein